MNLPPAAEKLSVPAVIDFYIRLIEPDLLKSQIADLIFANVNLFNESPL
jgi:hypothetical protein